MALLEKLFVYQPEKIGHKFRKSDFLKHEYHVTSDHEKTNTMPVFSKPTAKKPKQNVL